MEGNKQPHFFSKRNFVGEFESPYPFLLRTEFVPRAVFVHKFEIDLISIRNLKFWV